MSAIRRLSQLEVVLVLLIYLPLIGAFYIAAQRHGAERRHQAWAAAVDGSDLYDLLATGSLSPRPMLADLAAQRALVAVSEDTVGSLVDAGRVLLAPATGSLGMRLLIPDAELAERVRLHLVIKLATDLRLQPQPGGWLLEVPAARSLLDVVGVGLPPARVAMLQQAGLGVVARLRNYRGVSPLALDFMVAQAAGQGARLVLFEGDEVLGYPGCIKECAAALSRHGVRYCSVEFAKQRGDEALGRELEGELVRAHSITAAEMATIRPVEVVERFQRAVRERGIRLCYLHSYSGSRATPQQLLADIDQLSRGLARHGFRAAGPYPVPPLPLPGWIRWLVAVVPVAAAVLLLGLIYPLSDRARLVLLLLGLAAGAALFSLAPGLLPKEKALLAAVVFPSLSLVLLARSLELWHPAGMGRPELLLRAVLLLLTITLISLGGALVVVAMLSDRVYLAKADQFLGIKLASVAPVLLVLLVAAGKLYADNLSPRQWWALARSRLGSLLGRPVLLWQAVLAAAALGVLALFLLRTGNEPGLAISPLELKFRSLLEQYLPARPRTKEFLVGHPALMLAVAMAATGRRRWLVLALAAAAIGQVSVVNTFCHLHTPLALSLARVLTGLGVGAVVGAVVVLVWLALAGRLDKPQAGPPEAT